MTRMVPALRDLLGSAIAAHRGGRLLEAEREYAEILAEAPATPNVIRLLGVLCQQQGATDRAVELFRQAVMLDPRSAEAHRNLGVALHEQGRTKEAVGWLEKSIAIDPKYAQAFRNCGIVLQALDRLDEAVGAFHRAIALMPDYAEAHTNLGAALQEQDDTALAIASHLRAIELKPQLPAAHNNLGLSFAADDRLDNAVAALTHAIVLKPIYPEAISNLAVVLARQRRYSDALSECERALELAPESPLVARNFGVVLQDCHRPNDAIAQFRHAIDLKPDFVDAYAHLASSLEYLGHRLEALDLQRRAVALRPKNADAHLALGMRLLMRGEYEEGFCEYEWRRTRRRLEETSLVPKWNGQNPAGKTILLMAEQGLGDTIQFTRFARRLSTAGASVIVEVQPSLTWLLQSSMPELTFLPRGEASSEVDAQLPLMSLPHVLGTSELELASQIPYLSVDLKAAAVWRGLIPEAPFRVGIAWQGNPEGDRDRSAPLQAFRPLTSVAGVQLVSLQKGFGIEQLTELRGAMDVWSPGQAFDSGPRAFIDTIGIVADLDLVITTDTSIAHLVGALGRPVWIMLKHLPEWRWQFDREDSPWYPTARLFRQQVPGDWNEVVERLTIELSRVVAGERDRLLPRLVAMG